MKALVQDRYGSPEVLRVENLTSPVLGDGEVLIRVAAASVNARDWHIMRGEPRLARLADRATFGRTGPQDRTRGTVASDIFGVSGREMMAALIAGERNPLVLAEMARTCMRRNIPALREAFTGHFDEHHRFFLKQMLGRIDGLDADIARVEEKIETLIAPFADAAERLDEIPGIGPISAAIILAEVGTDMSRFPTAGHLCSWAKVSPGIKSSAGRKKGTGSTGHGNRYLARVLGETAVVIGRSDTFLGERYRRIARRRGKRRAIVAVSRSILVVVWHLLNDPETAMPTSAATTTTATSTPSPRSAATSAPTRVPARRVTIEPAA